MSHPSKIRYVGLDVHKNSIAIAVADGDRGPFRRRSPTTSTLCKALHRLGPPESLSCCYEAGPTGYGLYRKLKSAGFLSVVIAPSLVPVQAGNRVKTNRRDADKVAHFLRSGDLTTIHVADEATEAMQSEDRQCW